MAKTTATRATQENTRPTPSLYLAFELSLSAWKLALATSLGGKQLVRGIPDPDLERLNHEIDRGLRRFRLVKTTAVVSCYEAGRDGFRLHRFLENENITTQVVDPVSAEVNRRSRKA